MVSVARRGTEDGIWHERDVGRDKQSFYARDNG